MCLLETTNNSILNYLGTSQRHSTVIPTVLYSLFQKSYSVGIFLYRMDSVLTDRTQDPAKRVLSLKDPTAKMSKSARDENSRILLTDDTKTIQSKIRGAVTDSLPSISYDPEARPGTSNLLTLLAGCLDEDVNVIAERYKDKGHGGLKKDVIEVLEETLQGPREEFSRLKADPGHLQALADKGAERARQISQGTLTEVRRLVGLRP